MADCSRGEIYLFPFEEFDLQMVLLGEGRFGSTYKATRQGKEYAAKKLRKDEENDGKTILKNVKATFPSTDTWCEYVAELLAVSVHGEHCYLIYQYCEFGSLKTLTEQFSLSLKLKLKIMYDAAKGMAWIHDVLKMSHKNIKAANILVDSNCMGKVGDFGVSHLLSVLKKDDDGSTSNESSMYRPPEYSSSSGCQDNKKADVYRFGMTSYDIFSDVLRHSTDEVDSSLTPDGQDPSEGITIEAFITNLIQSCVKPEPSDRSTFKDILAEFNKDTYTKQVKPFLEEEVQSLKCSMGVMNGDLSEEESQEASGETQNGHVVSEIVSSKLKGCVKINISCQTFNGKSDNDTLKEINLRENRNFTRWLAKKFKCNIVEWNSATGHLYLKYREKKLLYKLKEQVDKDHFANYLMEHTEGSSIIFKASILADDWEALFDRSQQVTSELQSENLCSDHPDVASTLDCVDNEGSMTKEYQTTRTGNHTATTPSHMDFTAVYKVIVDEKSTYYMLSRVLAPLEEKVIADIDHWPIIHTCVVKNRMDLLKVVSWSGYWSKGMKSRIPSDCHWPLLKDYIGRTPLEIAKTKSRDIEDDLLRVDKCSKTSVPLRTAITKCVTNVVTRIIEAAASPTIVDDTFTDGMRPLHWACIVGNMDVWHTLISHGADVTLKLESGESLLHFACALGRPEIAKYLISTAKMSSTDRGPSGRSPVDYAAENGDIELFNVLVGLKARIEYSALILACMKGKASFLKEMFRQCRLDLTYQDRYGRTPLHHAAENGHMEAVLFLLSKGASIDALDKNGRNVIHSMADQGRAETLRAVKRYVKKTVINAHDRYIGADNCFLVKGSDKGRPAFHYVEVKRKYIKIFLVRTRGGNLEIAVYGEIIRSGFGAEPTTEDMRMIEKKYDDIIKSGINIPDMTPLHLAVMKEKWDVVPVLIELGADVNACDKYGCTPLHLVAMKGHTKTAEVLVNAGANVTTTDREGLQAQKIAEENKNMEVLQLLRSIVARNNIKSDLLKKYEELKKLVSAQNTPLDQLNSLLVPMLLDIDTTTRGILKDLGTGAFTVSEEGRP